MERIPFIAVEGPIGVGKTSLASTISKQFGYYFLQEIVEENPFLHKFYENINEWAFQTEMFFLCNRYKQLSDMEKDYLRVGRPVVADYHILKNIIFAKRTLNPNQYQKYEQIYHILTHDFAKPNLIIYLTADINILMDRIKKRGRHFEHNMDPFYLQQLSVDYEEFMEKFPAPVLRIDVTDIDFVGNPDDLKTIFSFMQPAIEKRSSI
ncbi:deoxynucleoside kinase [Bacillus sp. FJAT-49732]|uniref:Deoxynucleoside kinase n=1 Tax=Lederbergia citrisecunda TaxID=2833583 RepID=A0A942TQC0_9BACI|nr:deoxynucleoside kinase [Lederbergia citrisecunda]MBS4201443.1 deoxynucleoside kinase [Lederbergia citrisecunda]